MTRDEARVVLDEFLKNAGGRIKSGESIEVVAYEIVDTFVALTSDEYDPSLDSHFAKVFDIASYVELGSDYVPSFTEKSAELISLLKQSRSTE
jgi:hypothetical protein